MIHARCPYRRSLHRSPTTTVVLLGVLWGGLVGISPALAQEALLPPDAPPPPPVPVPAPAADPTLAPLALDPSDDFLAPVPPPDRDWRGGNWALAMLSGAAGQIGGGLAGSAIGLKFASGLCDDDDDNDWACFGEDLTGLAVGAIVGGTVGSAVGTYLYGRHAGDLQGGSFGATIGGAGLGTVGSLAVALLWAGVCDDYEEGRGGLCEHDGLQTLVMLGAGTLPVVGAAIGYHASARAAARQEAASPQTRTAPYTGALLSVQPGRTPTLAVPSCAVMRGKAGEVRVALPLLAGSF
ncbi:MAG: hypothetical protein RBU45_01920 [Myxococcota bacterium]|jgi:hypothetical protein|nr:hypothetical protein [Myxococcota bacterium]